MRASKNPLPLKRRGFDRLDLFSGIFNVARNPVNKSPRWLLLDVARAKVNTVKKTATGL